MTLLKSTAVRKKVHEGSGVQVSDDALAVLERHLEAVLEEAEAEAVKQGRKRLDGITMMVVVDDVQ